MTLDRLLDALARHWRTGRLVPDAQGAIGLRIGPALLDLRFDEAQDRIRLSLLVGRLRVAANDGLLAELLHANVFLAEQGSPVLAFDSEHQRLALCSCLVLSLADGPGLVQVVQAMVDAANRLGDSLAEQAVLEAAPA